jgi:glycosyltransferase involved in cell wall biosynthesis
MKISAFLVIYNEEKHLKRCLESLEDVVDEIIVIHDGKCSDKSLGIAKDFGAKVFTQEHRGMREFHQVFAIEQCMYDWILQIDADEFLSIELKNEIRNLVKVKDVDAYSFVWPLWNGNKYITKNFPYKKILFRKDKMYYFSFPGKDPGTYGNLVQSPLVLEHQPLYNNYTFNRFKSKWMKWIDVHAKFFYREEYDTYNCNKDVLKRFESSISKQRKYAHPILAPLWMIQSTIVSMFRHGYWKSLGTWKVAFLQGLYGYYLCVYIWKYRK